MAGKLLSEQDISCGVIDIHTIKPLDKEAILAAAMNSRVLITVEEHSICGGLGATCASLLLQEGVHRRFKIVGIPDEYTVTGSQEEIFAHYGITPQGLAKTAIRLLQSELEV